MYIQYQKVKYSFSCYSRQVSRYSRGTIWDCHKIFPWCESLDSIGLLQPCHQWQGSKSSCAQGTAANECEYRNYRWDKEMPCRSVPLNSKELAFQEHVYFYLIVRLKLAMHYKNLIWKLLLYSIFELLVFFCSDVNIQRSRMDISKEQISNGECGFHLGKYIHSKIEY